MFIGCYKIALCVLCLWSLYLDPDLQSFRPFIQRAPFNRVKSNNTFWSWACRIHYDTFWSFYHNQFSLNKKKKKFIYLQRFRSNCLWCMTFIYDIKHYYVHLNVINNLLKTFWQAREKILVLQKDSVSKCYFERSSIQITTRVYSVGVIIRYFDKTQADLKYYCWLDYEERVI